MTDRQRIERDRVIPALREFVDALDRRGSNADRIGEAEIAHEAAALRKEAVDRLAALTTAPCERPCPSPLLPLD